MKGVFFDSFIHVLEIHYLRSIYAYFWDVIRNFQQISMVFQYENDFLWLSRKVHQDSNPKVIILSEPFQMTTTGEASFIGHQTFCLAKGCDCLTEWPPRKGSAVFRIYLIHRRHLSLIYSTPWFLKGHTLLSCECMVIFAWELFRTKTPPSAAMYNTILLRMEVIVIFCKRNWLYNWKKFQGSLTFWVRDENNFVPKCA